MYTHWRDLKLYLKKQGSQFPVVLSWFHYNWLINTIWLIHIPTCNKQIDAVKDLCNYSKVCFIFLLLDIGYEMDLYACYGPLQKEKLYVLDFDFSQVIIFVLYYVTRKAKDMNLYCWTLVWENFSQMTKTFFFMAQNKYTWCKMSTTHIY